MTPINWDQLRAACPPVRFFEDRRVKLKRSGRCFVGRQSPFHQVRRGMAIIIDPGRQQWVCKGKCDVAGTLPR